MPAVIVPTNGVREIEAALADVDGDVTVVVSDSRFRVDAKDVSIATALIDATYPNVEALLPATGQPAFTVKPKSLNESLDRAFVVYTGTDIKAPAARLTAGMGGVELSAGQPQFDQGTEGVDATVHERGATFAVNARYLGEMLKMWPDVDMDVQPSGPGGPILFTSKDVPVVFTPG